MEKRSTLGNMTCLQRERPFECVHEKYEIKFSSTRKKRDEEQICCHETIILGNKMLEEYRSLTLTNDTILYQ